MSFAVYDSLPPKVREALQNALAPWKPEFVASQLKLWGETTVIAQIVEWDREQNIFSTMPRCNGPFQLTVREARRARRR